MKLLKLLLISSTMICCGTDASYSTIDPQNKQVILTERLERKPSYMIYRNDYLYTDKCFASSKQAHDFIKDRNEAGNFTVQEVISCR